VTPAHTLFTVKNNQPELELEALPIYGLFALVVRHQSFSHAAQLTGLARSAVSQRIARLEKRLGVELLRRTTRRVTPTEAGLRLFERCLPLVEQAERLRRDLHAELDAGPLRVNAPLSMTQVCLARLLVEFQATSPGTIDLSLDNRPIDLLETRADVVVRVSRDVPEDQVARRVAQTRLVVVGSRGYLEKHPAPAAPQDLVHHRCLRYASSKSEWQFGEGVRAYTVPVTGPFSATDGTILKRWVLADQGLAVLPTFMIADELRDGSLQTVLGAWRHDVLGVWAILPAARRAPKRAVALTQFLAKHLRAALPKG
jgi:DNA-binding transcriptional LysR family regulator